MARRRVFEPERPDHNSSGYIAQVKSPAVLVIVLFACMSSCEPSAPRQPQFPSGFGGVWNVSTYQTYDSLSFEWHGSVFNFGEDGKCLTPGRSGVPFTLDDGTWTLLNDSTMELHVKDTLLTGRWSIEPTKYSSVHGYEHVMLEATICSQRHPLCFNLYTKF